MARQGTFNGLTAATASSDRRGPRRTKALDRRKRALPKQPFLASFVDEDDGRYVRINGIIYPALLASCRSASGYLEDMCDIDDYPVHWCRQFGLELINRAAAVLVCDEGDYSWTFLGLFQVHDVRQTNFLACRIGAKLARLQLKPAPGKRST